MTILNIGTNSKFKKEIRNKIATIEGEILILKTTDTFTKDYIKEIKVDIKEIKSMLMKGK